MTRRWSRCCQLGLVGRSAARSLFICQTIEQGACLCSQYLADSLVPRHELRVFKDYVSDLWTSLYKLYNVLLEQRYVLVRESLLLPR